MVNFLSEKKENLIYFNSSSTSPFYNNLSVNNLKVLPTNVIRTAIIDDTLCYRLLNDFLYVLSYYDRIFLFKRSRQNQDSKVPGLSPASLKIRKRTVLLTIEENKCNVVKVDFRIFG